MTALIATPPKLQFFDAYGNPLVGGKLYSYAAGTTTPLATYTTAAGDTSNTNPIILDSRGEANVWFSDAAYKLKLASSTDVEIWTVDNLNGTNQTVLPSLAASNGSSLIGYIQSGAGAVATTVQARLRKVIFTSDYDIFANAVAAAADGTLIVNSTIALGNSLTVSSNVNLQVSNEGIINIANAVTLTINGCFDAGVYQVFSCTGTGKVVFNSQFTSVGYPEWWGAITNTSVDCLAAMNACVLACTVTQLQAADYFISNTLKIQTRTRTLRGMGFNYLGNDSSSATRVIVASGTVNCIQMGPDTEPAGGINDFLTDVRVENLQATRSIAPIINSSCSGILNQYTLYSYIDKVKAAENQIGFHLGGCVQAHTTDCYAFRSTAGTGAGTDLFYGYYINGLDYDIGAAGGNASIYFDVCNATSAGSAPSNSIGFYARNNFTDCYISNCETNSTAYGIYVDGNGLTTQQYGNNDLLITAPVIDVFTIAGIRFNNISKFGSVSVNGGYCAPAGGAGPIAGLYFTSSLGQVSISDFQIIGNSSSSCTGITAVTARNIESRTQIIDCNTSPISLTGVENSRFLDHVTNYGNSTSSAVVTLASDCYRNYFLVFATGKASAFTLGYQGVGTTNVHNELNCTGLDSTAIAAGSANKLTWNGTQITTTGLIATGSTNLASGVMT